MDYGAIHVYEMGKVILMQISLEIIAQRMTVTYCKNLDMISFVNMETL